MSKQTLKPAVANLWDFHCVFAQSLQSVPSLVHLLSIYTGISLFPSFSFSHSLSKQDVCVSVGLTRPVQSWWSDSMALECPALPALQQIKWDLGLPFGFPTKPTHRKRQQNTGGHAADSTLPLDCCCLDSEAVPLHPCLLKIASEPLKASNISMVIKSLWDKQYNGEYDNTSHWQGNGQNEDNNLHVWVLMHWQGLSHKPGSTELFGV